MMKTIEVVAAVLLHNGSYLATQRGYGEFAGGWEFPGGKIEIGEHPEEALKREIEEELGIEIIVKRKLCTTEYDYPAFHLTMHSYICHITSGEIELREHQSARWLTTEELNVVAWLPADIEVVKLLKEWRDYVSSG